MKTFHVKWLVPGALVAFAAFMEFSLASVSAKPVITSQVNEMLQKVDANGQVRLVAVKPDRIMPGDRVMYTTRIANHSKKASENIVITNPIPQYASYLGGTAQGQNFTIAYSVDGGQNWGQPGQLQVRNANGQMRQAQPSEYTHIRWQYQGVLQPAQAQRISYQALLK